MPSLNDLGAIASINVPDGWLILPPDELPGGRQIQEISPYDRSDVIFLSSVRAVELSAPGRTAFMSTLYSNFHQLNQTEIHDLRDVLEGMANTAAFTIETAHTAYLNSRRIIRVSGLWLELKQKETACFVDLTGDCQRVQQLSLIAPIKDFEQFVELVERQILLSIEWRKSP